MLHLYTNILNIYIYVCTYHINAWIIMNLIYIYILYWIYLNIDFPTAIPRLVWFHILPINQWASILEYWIKDREDQCVKSSFKKQQVQCFGPLQNSSFLQLGRPNPITNPIKFAALISLKLCQKDKPTIRILILGNLAVLITGDVLRFIPLRGVLQW